MWGCKALTCRSSASPLWHYTSCLLLWKTHTTPVGFLPAFSCCQRRRPGRHPSLPLLWDLTSHRAERGQLPSPWGRREGRGGAWLAPSLPLEEVTERRPAVFTENTGVPRNIPSLWMRRGRGGVERDFTTTRGGGNGLDGYSTTPSSAPPFSLECLPSSRCARVCACVRGRGGVPAVLTSSTMASHHLTRSFTPAHDF